MCLYCDHLFKSKRDTKKYCSEQHRRLMWKRLHRDKENAWQKKRKFWKEWYSKNRKVEIKPRECPICQTMFTPDWRHNFQKFCSEKCRRKPQKARYRIKHKEYIKKKDEEYKAKIRFGTTSKTYNKYEVLKRDRRTCQICMKPYEVIHHIRYTGRLEHLICLCRACHASIHQRFTEEPYWYE